MLLPYTPMPGTSRLCRFVTDMSPRSCWCDRASSSCRLVCFPVFYEYVLGSGDLLDVSTATDVVFRPQIHLDFIIFHLWFPWSSPSMVFHLDCCYVYPLPVTSVRTALTSPAHVPSCQEKWPPGSSETGPGGLSVKRVASSSWRSSKTSVGIR